MNHYVKSYVTFVAFLAVTAIVVKPLAKQVGVPFADQVFGA